jgi:murein DD-endopeptidase MepM/ murein hydrolase activator NlpD
MFRNVDKQNNWYGRATSEFKKINWKTFIIICGVGLAIGAITSRGVESGAQLQASLTPAEELELGAFPITIPTIKYGFAIDTFNVLEAEIEPNQFLGDILTQHKMDYVDIEQLVQNAKGTFDVRQLRAGKKYTILSRDTAQGADHFIYEPSVYGYYVFDLKGQKQVRKVERPIDKEMRVSEGEIETSLWDAMVLNGMTFDLAARMEDALQWSVDFHHLQKGDKFKLVYEQNMIEGQDVGVEQVYAAYYKNLDNEHFAVYYEHPDVNKKGYYDLEGRPMNKGFLKAPVKYSRISSGYNPNRFHPILKRRKPHYGTDYAAPYGTPIYAVGNGVVTKASRTRGNGNFVKIKHNDTYQTQYLHMQKFAKGITPGAQVKQGQVIGYVGSTGLATGPHVCFRFWKNGKQVNHLKLNFPPPKSLPVEDLPGFYEIRDDYLAQLGLDIKPKERTTEENTENTISE